MRQTKRYHRLITSVISWMMAVAMMLGMIPAMTATAAAVEPSEGGRITAAEANALLKKAGSGTELVEKALTEHIQNVNTTEHGLCGGASHLQGICVDDELKYMYFSYTTALAKVKIETGELVGTVTDFGPGSFGVEGGAHLGCLDYYDGHIYASLEYKSPGKKFFLAIFDANEITSVGMDVNDMGGENKVVNGVLLAEPTYDFRDPVDTEVFTGQDTYNEATNEECNGHRFACSGIDGVTVGKWPGGGDDELYMIVAYGVYQFKNDLRQDNTYNVLQFYKMDTIWQAEDNEWNLPFNGSRGTSRDIGENEALKADKTLYVYTGNTSYGAQNIEYEWDTGDIVLYTYENTDGFGGTLYVVDGSAAPAYKTLELGQNNTLAKKADRFYAQWVAEAYATDENGNGEIEEDEYLKGYVAELKCICGGTETHNVSNIKNGCYGDTGVAADNQFICSSDCPASGTTGIHWLGADPGDDAVDYFFIANGTYQTGLYKRTLTDSGVSFKQIVWLEEEEVIDVPVMRWTMDAADLAEDGTIKNVTEQGRTYDGSYANVRLGEGVDGRANGSLYFDGDADALDYSRAWMGESGVAALEEMVRETGTMTISYWYKPEYAGANNFTSDWAPILGIYSAHDWATGPARFMLVTEFRSSGLTMCMNNYSDKMSWPVDIRSKTSGGANGTDWHHIVMTVDLKKNYDTTLTGGTSLYREFYIDGVAVGQDRALYPENKNTVLTGMTDFEIGGAPYKCWSDTNVRGRFSGWIDDVRIYNTSLSAANVAYLMQHPTATQSGSVDLSEEKPETVTAWVFDKQDPADLTITLDEAVTSVTGVTEGYYRVSGKTLTLAADWLMTRQPGAVDVTVNGETVTVHVLNSNGSYPIAYYKLDGTEDGKTADASGNRLDADVTRAEFKGGAASFNGYHETQVDRIQVSDSDFLRKAIGNQATISFWFKTNRIVGNNTNLVGLYGDNAQPALLAKLYSGGGERTGAIPNCGPVTMKAQTLSSSSKGWNANEVAGSNVTADTWALMTVVYDDGMATVYVNGVQAGTGTVLSDNLTTVDTLILGGAQNVFYPTVSGSKSQNYQTNFYGELDEVLLYNTALTAGQAAALNNNRVSITLPVDRTGLTWLVEKAGGNAGLAAAVEAANGVLNSADATAEAVTTASETLLNAMQTLAADKAALSEAVTAASAKAESSYTSGSWSEMKTKLDAAKDVLNSFTAAQTQVDAAAAALNAAVDALVDISALRESVTEASAIKQGGYTGTTWNTLQTKLTEAKTVLNNADATKEQVETAKTALDAAVSGLKENTSTGGGGGGSSASTYAVSVRKTVNGSVTSNPKNARKGETVTITVEPDKGYALESLTVLDKNGKEIKLTDKVSGKYTFTMPSSNVEIKATFMEDNSVLNFFYDVPNDAYYYDAVKWAVKKGITGGVGNNLFAPNQPCTRAQIVTFLWRAAGSPEPKNAASFTDVPASAYYAKAVAWAIESGITLGTTDTTFSPDAVCTRAQAVAFLFRANADIVTLQELVSGYRDAARVPGYALSAFNWALANGVMQGYDNALMPNMDCTRAQIVTFLYRAYQSK